MNTVFYSNLLLVQNSLLTTKRRVGIEEGGAEQMDGGCQVVDSRRGGLSDEAGSWCVLLFFRNGEEYSLIHTFTISIFTGVSLRCEFHTSRHKRTTYTKISRWFGCHQPRLAIKEHWGKRKSSSSHSFLILIRAYLNLPECPLKVYDAPEIGLPYLDIIWTWPTTTSLPPNHLSITWASPRSPDYTCVNKISSCAA